MSDNGDNLTAEDLLSKPPTMPELPSPVPPVPEPDEGAELIAPTSSHAAQPRLVQPLPLGRPAAGLCEPGGAQGGEVGGRTVGRTAGIGFPQVRLASIRRVRVV
jgi:hypothetical protein